MKTPINDIVFTGEFFVPGSSGERVEADHMERYLFACNFIRACKVLDIACGFGYGGPLLINSGAIEYHGVDLSIELIKNAQYLYANEKISYSQGDICYYSSKDIFDTVICFETIEHVSNYRAALKNINKLLRDNGVLIISSPNRKVTSPVAKNLLDSPANPYHTQEFTIDELRKELNDAGFSVSDDNIFGQRNSFLYFRNDFSTWIVRSLFGDPSETSSAKVKKFCIKTPRYFVLVAIKNPERNI